MQRDIERRAAGIRRVAVDRIVDVCATSAAPSSAFQGRSVDVSGRGMSVRAAHLPELNAPIVVRFQEHGSEVIAEGVVAWRREAPRGPEFGVRFTALDSRSVQSLQALCQSGALPGVIVPRPEPEDGDTEPVPDAGTSVKLHIGGLGAPLSARVRQQGERRLSLGSSLDFLRVGRSVEIEEGAPGKRRNARIDEVDVAIDPQSQIPELIVSLRFDPSTPLPLPAASREPSQPAPVVHGAERLEAQRPAETATTGAAPAASLEPAGGNERRGAPASSPAARAGDPVLADEAEDDEGDELELGEAHSSERPPPIIRMPFIRRPSADTLRSRGVGSESPVAPSVARADEGDDEGDEPEPPSVEPEESDGPNDLDRLRQRLDGLLDGLSSAARVTGERCRELGGAASRTATRLAAHARTASEGFIASRRATAPARRTSAAPRPSLRSAIARASSRVPGARADGARGAGGLPRGTWLALGFIALAAIGAWRGRPAPGALPPPAPAATTAPSAPSAPEPEPTSPSSPRPLVPDVESDSASEPETALAQGPLAGALPPSAAPEVIARPTRPEQRALARFAPAEPAFDEAPRARKPSAPAEFSSGRLELPIVHRLQLDRPGESLRGERTPTGFDVVVVGRKALESPTSIARRDARIAKATLRNGSDGARLSFRFRSTIPAYKVRLRKDYVEIFISSK